MEILAFEQKRLSLALREGVSKTIAEVEPGGVTALAELSKSFAGYLGLDRINGDNLDICRCEQAVQRAHAFGPVS